MKDSLKKEITGAIFEQFEMLKKQGNIPAGLELVNATASGATWEGGQTDIVPYFKFSGDPKTRANNNITPLHVIAGLYAHMAAIGQGEHVLSLMEKLIKDGVDENAKVGDKISFVEAAYSTFEASNNLGLWETKEALENAYEPFIKKMEQLNISIPSNCNTLYENAKKSFDSNTNSLKPTWSD